MSAFSQKFQKSSIPLFYLSLPFTLFFSENSGTNPTNTTKPKTKPTGWEDDDDEPNPPLKQEPIREFKPVTHTLASVSSMLLRIISIRIIDIFCFKISIEN